MVSDVDTIPADLDRFLANFFKRRDWRSEVKYDAAENRLYLEVRLASGKLSGDDRFLSLVEYFARAQDLMLRRQAGMKLQCRLYAADGDELTAELHRRGSSYLDDDQRSAGMRRRLAWLGFKRRFFAHVIPGALLWSVAIIFLVGVVGLGLDVVVMVAFGALLVQSLILSSRSSRKG